MDSAKSFFPTRANIPSRTARRTHLYRLCTDHSHQDPSYSTLDPPSNIFRETEESREVPRPVGGEELFRRMDLLAQERKAQGRKMRRTSREYQPRNVQTSIGNANIKRTATESDAPLLDLRILLKQPTKATLAEELFKSHHNYQPTNSECGEKQETGSMRRGIARSVQSIQPKFAPARVMERIDRQVQEHQDKSALLGEMDHVRPLVELCGDQYFEMTLRNRFKEDVKLPGYVYRIKDKFTENKVISRLRSFRPTVVQRRQLVLKGHRKTNSTIE